MTLEERIEWLEWRLDAIEKKQAAMTINPDAITVDSGRLKKVIAERSVNRNPVSFPKSF